MNGLVTLPSLMSSSLTSGVPLGMPRLAASRPPSRPLSDLAPLGGSLQGEGHYGPDPRTLLSSPRTMQSGGGAGPPPHSDWYHPSPAPTLAGVPGPPLPCSPPTSAGSGAGGGGRDQPDWAATPPPTLSASAAKLVSHLPGACLGVVTSLVSCCRECRRGAFPPSANAIMPSPTPCPTQRGVPSPWSLLPLHLKH